MPKLTPKRSKLTSKAKQPEKVGIMEEPKAVQKPTSVRLTLHEKSVIASLKKELNGFTRRKISESDVVRALISVGSKSDIETIFEAYKDSM